MGEKVFIESIKYLDSNNPPTYQIDILVGNSTSNQNYLRLFVASESLKTLLTEAHEKIKNKGEEYEYEYWWQKI